MKSFEHQCLDFWRSKPANETYDYTWSQTCAMARFISESGLGEPSTFLRWRDNGGALHDYPKAMKDAANGYCLEGGWTFGAAADRLERLLAS